MADPLYELLTPYFHESETRSSHLPPPSPSDPRTKQYLARLSTLSITDLIANEPASLQQSTQSQVRNLQALSKRSHKAIITSSTHLSNLGDEVSLLTKHTGRLQDEVPELESAATAFVRKYDRSTENAVLDKRKEAMLLARTMDRVSDILELPTLLASAVSSAQLATASSSSSSAATSYSSALDLQAHIKRLSALYSQSQLIKSISTLADGEMKNMTAMLISTLQSPQLKLAGAMRTVGWLRRVAPDLAGNHQSRVQRDPLFPRNQQLPTKVTDSDGVAETLFLVCRLNMLQKTLDALEPLRELADQETTKRERGTKDGAARSQPYTSTFGSQTERFLKRYIEIFREQSFSIISMYKSIFPSGLPTAGRMTEESDADNREGSILPLPSALASFALHIEDMLTTSLRIYMPNVMDRSARESLLTQVLYCAGSLGRLGADFGMSVALLDDEMSEDDGAEVPTGIAVPAPEWAMVMRKHRVQASRLEVLARGVSTGRKASTDLLKPSPAVTAAL
ncbi:Dor1-domain-containing protein [Polychaeton citri CBS 116435]|uniref:Conserved oligomeric Golgi complex subunit 8 n=1 Tax=Polychaeton citri CBS 116435 TaxID=1314669 RepID=A0A9P4Q0B5_9PEZI|nr:Dor1-domain-containing protein [Polychaeton citri CBS 116435]